MKISIDVDGVLAHFDTPFAKLLTEVTGKPCDVTEPDCWEWPLQAGFSKTEEGKAWEYIRNHPHWWSDLQPYPDSFVDYRSYQKAGWDIYFVTARRLPFVKEITEEWLRRHYLVDNPTVILSGRKGLVAKAIGLDAHIDDKPENTVDVRLNSGSTRSYLRTRRQNAMAQPYLARDGVILTASVATMFDSELERLASK